jgi:hypothetical protein
MERKWTEEEFLAALNKEFESAGLSPVKVKGEPGEKYYGDRDSYKIAFKKKVDQDPFEHLVRLLHKLKDNYGWFIISSKQHHLYCQLRRNKNEKKTRFEAVSHYYNETLDKKLESDFKSLGFHLAEKGNYQKKINLDSDAVINLTAFEIMKIFQDIYKVYEEHGFEFDDQIGTKAYNPKAASTASKKLPVRMARPGGRENLKEWRKKMK